MSDTSDFRGGSREQKRQDETVMLNSDNLSDMVSQAKDGDPPPATPPKESGSPVSGDDDNALGSTPMARILVLVGIILIILVAAYLIYDKVIG